jgi:beta-phosphoglucomutase
MDGTLVDTADLHFEAWRAMCQELGRPFDRRDFAATFGWRNPEILAHLFGPGRFSAAEIEQIGFRKEELYRTATREAGVMPLPGVRELVEELAEAGVPQAIGSSAPRANLELILDLLGLHARFGALVACEDTQRGKPDPQVFLVAAQRLGVPSARCLVLEDAVVGVAAARAAGMKSIAVRFVGHHPADKLQAAGADRVVDSLAEVNLATIRGLLGA